MVAEKEAAIQKALQYRFSSFDVDKILASKEKFSKHPHNYAMTKTKLLKEKGQVCPKCWLKLNFQPFHFEGGR